MRTLFYLLLLASLWLTPAVAFAQAGNDTEEDSDVPEIEAWRGGNLNFGFRLGFDLMGSSAGSGYRRETGYQ